MSLNWKVIDQSHMATECKSYTISRAPAANHATYGCQITYTLWCGKQAVRHEKCENIASERTTTINQLKELAENHNSGNV